MQRYNTFVLYGTRKQSGRTEKVSWTHLQKIITIKDLFIFYLLYVRNGSSHREFELMRRSKTLAGSCMYGCFSGDCLLQLLLMQ